MNYLTTFILLAFFLAITNSGFPQTKTDNEIEKLISQMTLEEKVGQMTNIGLTAICKGPFWNDTDSLEIDTIKLKNMLIKHHVGSVQNKGKYPPSKEEWHRLISSIQKFQMSQSRLKIPVLFGIDGVHGANYTASSTLFPHQIACAATWDPIFAEKTAEITAYEMRASSIPWNYAPVLDISYQPLWGRIYETYGEDNYLAGEMGKAFIYGSQGNDLANDKKAAVCLKHFVGYGVPYNGKDRSTAIISDRDLREYFIPPFEQAIRSGAKTIMLNSGSVNGIPGHINHQLITDILKGELGFEGFVVSDWDDLSKLVGAHNVAKDNKEAAKLAVMAGMDMCMVPYDESFAVHLTELVNEGAIPIERINDAVGRILRVKFELDLFNNPFTDPELYPLFGSKEFADASYEAAKECITLLKNENNILPLKKTSKILVTGPTSQSINYLNGGWSRTWSGVEEDYNDPGKAGVLDAIIAKIGNSYVSFALGSGIDYEIDFNSAVKLAEESDLIIACLGENPATEKPSDIDDLNLPEVQINLVKKLALSGKPIILVLIEGRPRVISEIEGLSQAIVMAYLPGQEGGRAIADVLFGDFNPCGRLPYTYPRYSGSIWKYNHKGADAMDKDFTLKGFQPQFEFGEGMSYTNFEYSVPRLSSDTISSGDSLNIMVDITNTGKIHGKEVVQLYKRDLVASVSPDIKKLVGFKKIGLEPGQTKTVEFTIYNHDLAFVGTNNEWITETGEFQVLIGGTPGNLQIENFYFKQK